MTEDERMERLVGAFGQTISDLHPAKEYKLPTARLYLAMQAAEEEADDWYDTDKSTEMYDACVAYICHLADIIDRMEAALETARRWMPCSTCEFNDDQYVCNNKLDVCTYRIRDINLRDMAIGADPEHLERETPEGRNDRVGTDSQGD